MRKVMVFGTFDIFHEGHKSYIKQAREHGDFVLAVVARDVNVKKIKGNSPKNNEELRLSTVAKSGLVDLAILGSEDNPYKIIEDQKPDVIALGYDQTSYTAGLQEAFPDIEIVRLESYKPEIYKSSKLK